MNAKPSASASQPMHETPSFRLVEAMQDMFSFRLEMGWRFPRFAPSTGRRTDFKDCELLFKQAHKSIVDILRAINNLPEYFERLGLRIHEDAWRNPPESPRAAFEEFRRVHKVVEKLVSNFDEDLPVPGFVDIYGGRIISIEELVLILRYPLSIYRESLRRERFEQSDPYHSQRLFSVGTYTEYPQKLMLRPSDRRQLWRRRTAQIDSRGSLHVINAAASTGSSLARMNIPSNRRILRARRTPQIEVQRMMNARTNRERLQEVMNLPPGRRMLRGRRFAQVFLQRMTNPRTNLECRLGPAGLDETMRRGGEAVRGASEEQINGLPVLKTANDDAEVLCNICCETITAGKWIRILPCLHRFHQDCIDRWLKIRATCPNERYKVFE